MPWVTPKTDWTTDDYYNFQDLNRVEGNIDALADLIATYATRPGVVGVLTSRDMSSIEFFDSLNCIENNLIILANASYQPPGWVTAKTNWASLDPFGFVDANRLESNLQNLLTLINNIKASFIYAGTFAAGQDIVL